MKIRSYSTLDVETLCKYTKKKEDTMKKVPGSFPGLFSESLVGYSGDQLLLSSDRQDLYYNR